MVIWVAEIAMRAVGREHVYVATEDKRISDVVESNGFQAIWTSSEALTGTDRLAEAAAKIDYDIYINVQGDEPLISPDDILKCIEVKKNNFSKIVNGFCWISEDEDPESVNLPKVVTNESGDLLYMSRKAIPGSKNLGGAPKKFKKQVCIYGFSGDDLKAYADFGRKSELEEFEDIEILRFFELNRSIIVFEAEPGSLAVDVPEDVPKVEAALRKVADLAAL